MSRSVGPDVWDMIVIGGGAAGLMCAASAIREGQRVLLLEKNKKLGVKILMSGGTRCNITHACDKSEIVRAFGQPGKFLHSSLSRLTPLDVVDWIESEGVATKTESGGKIFPCSDRAIDVRDALVRLATSSQQPGSCKILSGCAVREVKRPSDYFDVQTDEALFRGRSVVITTGGKSYPGCGTTGDGYEWAKSFGHKIVPPVAALTPIVNEDFWTHSLKGITFEDVEVCVVNNTGSAQELDRRRGGFLFTHFGYSGPAVLDVSRVISRFSHPNQLQLTCDFRPRTAFASVIDDLSKQLKQHPRQTMLNVMTESFARRFVESVLHELRIDPARKAGEVARNQVVQFVRTIKHAQFPISGTYGFAKAEVTAGGVRLDEVDSRTMQSKIQPGLYFAGEILDLDGPIGGYNFQSAFSTGWLAGKSQVESVKN